MEVNSLLDYIKMLANMTSGQQKEFYEAELANAKTVRCVPLCDVFTSEEINRIKNYVKPQKKECYKNAHLLCVWFPEKAQYVEGQTSYCGIGIDHAFNKIGDKYVDITMALLADLRMFARMLFVKNLTTYIVQVDQIHVFLFLSNVLIVNLLS